MRWERDLSLLHRPRGLPGFKGLFQIVVALTWNQRGTRTDAEVWSAERFSPVSLELGALGATPAAIRLSLLHVDPQLSGGVAGFSSYHACWISPPRPASVRHTEGVGGLVSAAVGGWGGWGRRQTGREEKRKKATQEQL